MSDFVKTNGHTVDDPYFSEPAPPNPTAGRPTSSFQPEPLIERRNASKTMDYFTLIAMLILVLSPVLVPLVITGFHTVGTWRQRSESSNVGPPHAWAGPATAS